MNCLQLEPQGFFKMGDNHLKLIAASSPNIAIASDLSAYMNMGYFKIFPLVNFNFLFSIIITLRTVLYLISSSFGCLLQSSVPFHQILLCLTDPENISLFVGCMLLFPAPTL